jgi:hypothetical protein
MTNPTPAFPQEIQKILTRNQQAPHNGNLVAHYELFKRIKHLDGAIVKCGITASEGFARFATFRSLVGDNHHQPMIAFEKYEPEYELVQDGNQTYMTVKQKDGVPVKQLKETLKSFGQNENVSYLPGNVGASIPDFLIEHPEAKIALLNIDLDDFESTLTVLEYLYPRVVPGGVIIIDNYHKLGAETLAVNTYFMNAGIQMQHFSLTHGPYFIFK